MLNAIIIGINLIYPPQPRYICLPSGAGQTSTCRLPDGADLPRGWRIGDRSEPGGAIQVLYQRMTGSG